MRTLSLIRALKLRQRILRTMSEHEWQQYIADTSNPGLHLCDQGSRSQLNQSFEREFRGPAQVATNAPVPDLFDHFGYG
jgi:hypothetical protein